jgi:hypothetical protein
MGHSGAVGWHAAVPPFGSMTGVRTFPAACLTDFELLDDECSVLPLRFTVNVPETPGAVRASNPLYACARILWFDPHQCETDINPPNGGGG